MPQDTEAIKLLKQIRDSLDEIRRAFWALKNEVRAASVERGIQPELKLVNENKPVPGFPAPEPATATCGLCGHSCLIGDMPDHFGQEHPGARIAYS